MTLDRAVDLLLKSIAMEETSLEKLLEMEQKKVLAVLSQCKCGSGTRAVNRSVDEMVETIAQLQLLLRNKMKQVWALRPCSSPHCLPGPCCGPGCSVMGEGKGIIGNTDDSYCHQTASVYTFFPCGDRKNGTLRYRVGDSCRGLHLYACNRNVTLHCRTDGSRQIVVDGAGRIKLYSEREPEQIGTASFTLTVKQGKLGDLAFRMELTGRGALCLKHDSGWVQVDSQCSRLRVRWCQQGSVGK